MLYWSLIFFVISLIAGLLGMNNVAGLTMEIAQFLIGLFLVLAIITLVLGVLAFKKAKSLLK